MTGQTATGGPVRRRKRAGFIGPRAGRAPLAALIAASAAGLLLGVGPAAADPSIQDKRAQAQAILAEVQQLDTSLEQTIESYNYATVELDRIDGELATNARHLKTATKSLTVAQARIAIRLRDLYVNGQGDSTLEVLLGSSSLDEVIARLDAIERVSSQDAGILKSVKRFRKEVETRRATLKGARAKQVQVVADRAAQKASIEGRLAERERLLASVKDEIARLRAEEQRRQAALAAEARARAAAAQKAAQAAALAQVDLQPTYVEAPSTPSYDPNLPAPRYSGVVAIALQYLGVPYVWGGSSPSTGFDCSGFTEYVFAQIGVSLPHHAASQYALGTPVAYDQLAPGDLVFFEGLGHVGIYIGGGQFIHAPHTGDVVKISSLAEHGSYVGARRL